MDGAPEETIDDATVAANDPTLQEASDGIVLGKPIFHDGRWGLATLEVQLALMQSAREQREIQLSHQVAVRSAHWALLRRTDAGRTYPLIATAGVVSLGE